MSSWFSSSTPAGPNIHPVQTTFSDPNALFGPLTAKDLEWNCAGGINTETQVRRARSLRLSDDEV